MMRFDWREEAIARQKGRESFTCGDPDLDEYLKKFARQAHDRGGAKTFLAIGRRDDVLLGYYALSPASVAYARTPEVMRRGLARHDVPMFRLARLAVALGAQGVGLGGQLLLAAGERCLRVSREVGEVGLLIDAKSERAALWYQSYGATRFEDAPLTLVLPFATSEAALGAKP